MPAPSPRLSPGLSLCLCACPAPQVILDKACKKRDLDAKVIQAGMFNDKSTNLERQQVAGGGEAGGGGGGQEGSCETTDPRMRRGGRLPGLS